MIRFILDGNVYDKVDADPCFQTLIKNHILSGDIEIICNQVILAELKESPFGGVPDWFPVKMIHEPNAFIGRALIAPNDVSADDDRYARITSTESVYSEHVGKSKKKRDAIIASTASKKADYAVSEDKRFKNRLNKSFLNEGCSAISFAEFRKTIQDLSKG